MLATPNKIDLVTRTPEGVLRLHLVIEAGEWARPDAQDLLADKANAYAAFALDGQMAQQYPDAREAEVVISAAEPPPADTARVLDQLVDLMRKEIPVHVEPLYQAAA